MYSSDDNLPSEQPQRQPSTTADSPTTAADSSTALNRLRSIARLRTADAGAYGMSREELEELKDVVDENLRKYHRHYDDGGLPRPAGKKRPHVDPYIGQILDELNGERHTDGYGEMFRRTTQQRPQTLPVRRKIIRHTVFAGPSNSNRRMYGGSVDGSSRIEWTSPWADYFPILINDPFQSVMNSFSEIIEYGPAADICRHATALTTAAAAAGDGDVDKPDGSRKLRLKRSRRHATTDEEKGLLRPLRPNHTAAAAAMTTTEQPKLHWGGERPVAGEHNGDMGPQIKRLVVRRGGVAIAGPGGIATAGTGGTAIVGPGGTAYSTKDTASAGSSDAPAAGVSMAGYGPHVIQRSPPPPPPPGLFATHPYNAYGTVADGGTAVLSSDGVTYTFPVPSRGLTAAGTVNGPTASHTGPAGRQISLPDGAKLIATGPIVYYNPEPKKRSRKGRKLSSHDRKSASAVGAQP